MRILHISDFHFHKPWFAWARRQADQYDAVAFTGDLIGRVDRVSAERQIEWLTGWVENFPGRLLLCSGNHDERWDDVPPTLQNWVGDLRFGHVTTDNQCARIDSWNFECVSWGGVPSRGGSKQITLMHCPPHGADTGISDLEGIDYGCPDLAQILQGGSPLVPPWLVLSGHIHRPRKWHQRIARSWSLSPGCGRSLEEPNHIRLDLGRGLAEYHSAGCPAETLKLRPSGE
jgi:predicted MPP superfamily phosphohydrolase